MTGVRLLLCYFVFTAVLMLNGCADGLPAVAIFDAPKNDLQHDRAATEVAYDRETYICSDPRTQVTPAPQIASLVDQWTDSVDSGQKYSPPAIDHQNPAIGYPKSLYADHVYGAVYMLILINRNGSVSSSKAICASRPEFVPYATKAVALNRYRPARINGKALQSTAAQEIDFVPHPYPY